MLSRKLFRWMHKVALFAILFASVAPSISHALTSQSGQRNFLQEVCGVGGQKLIIQVLTTKGQALEAALDTQPGSQPASINLHLQHCPFCHAGVANIAIPSRNATFDFYLAQQLSEHRADFQTPVFSTIPQSAHPARAPPSISL
jgi:hypothetical protein